MKQDMSEKSSNTRENIYSVLKKEHREVKGMFEQILKEKKPNAKIFNKIMEAVQPHMSGEEKYLYATVKSKVDPMGEEGFIVNEAFEEHRLAKILANEICNLQQEDEMWIPKVKVLSDMIEHHVEEEEGEFFKTAKKLLSNEEAEEILMQYMQEKKMKM